MQICGYVDKLMPLSVPGSDDTELIPSDCPFPLPN